VTQAVRDSKLALMVIAWDAEWGDFSTFRNWVNDGEKEARAREEGLENLGDIFH
jgi:hypothetical protein